jgi:hypothetical protein
MFSRFSGLSHLAYPLLQVDAPGSRQPAAPAQRAADGPVFLHSEFAPFEPDLTGELRQALGEAAARRVGDVP